METERSGRDRERGGLVLKGGQRIILGVIALVSILLAAAMVVPFFGREMRAGDIFKVSVFVFGALSAWLAIVGRLPVQIGTNAILFGADPADREKLAAMHQSIPKDLRSDLRAWFTKFGIEDQELESVDDQEQDLDDVLERVDESRQKDWEVKLERPGRPAVVDYFLPKSAVAVEQVFGTSATQLRLAERRVNAALQSSKCKGVIIVAPLEHVDYYQKYYSQVSGVKVISVEGITSDVVNQAVSELQRS